MVRTASVLESLEEEVGAVGRVRCLQTFVRAWTFQSL